MNLILDFKEYGRELSRRYDLAKPNKSVNLEEGKTARILIPNRGNILQHTFYTFKKKVTTPHIVIE